MNKPLFAGAPRGQLEVRVRTGPALPHRGTRHHPGSGPGHGQGLPISVTDEPAQEWRMKHK